MSNRRVIKIAGESGMGIESTGMIVMKSLKNMGFFVYGEREFPSLIKGGRANIQINFSRQKVRSLSTVHDVGLAVDREGLLDCLDTIKSGGIVIHAFERWPKVIKDLPKIAAERNLKVIQVPAREIALENGGNIIMTNVVLLGYLWKVLGLDIAGLESQISKQFTKKPDLIPVNLRCAKAGFEYVDQQNPLVSLGMPEGSAVLSSENGEKRILIDGNTSIALGAIQAGVRAYFGYPMSPATSILVYIANAAKKTGMLVKQLEDEISVVQATIGAMHMGTRALCATSGGGFDLMTETVSLSAMIETPLVCVVVQRPGPATGLPTWTGQADLNLAIFSAHGEFARCVIACSDPESCYEQIQHAFNIAEKYQIPVTVLSEACIGMTYATEEAFKENHIPIIRGLTVEQENLAEGVNNSDLKVRFTSAYTESRGMQTVEKLESRNRFEITEDGLSKRWIPGSSSTTYFANGDEHYEDGTIAEASEPAREMISKRIRKMDTMKKELPDPEVFVTANSGPKKIGIVGWGSTKNTVLDVMESWKGSETEISYLHYTYMWPLKTEKLEEFFANNDEVYLMEGNHEGQLGKLIERETDLKFAGKLLKWDGRPFYIEEVQEFLQAK